MRRSIQSLVSLACNGKCKCPSDAGSFTDAHRRQALQVDSSKVIDPND